MVLPPLVPQAEGLARVEIQVAALAVRAQAVEATQRLGLVPERREPVPQRPPLALSLAPELRLPEVSPAA